MPEFAYQGRNARGELVKGVLEGASSSAVADQLFSTGITPVHINEAKAAAALAVGKLQGRFGEPKVDLADLMLLSRQMHILLKAGVPIIRALSGLHESATNPALRRTIAEVRESLESGRELSQALLQHRKVFPAFMVSLVRVGEITGLLDEVFMRLYEFFAFEKKMREDTRAALRYPTMVIIAVALAMCTVTILVFPAFVQWYPAFHAQLPLRTRIL